MDNILCESGEYRRVMRAHAKLTEDCHYTYAPPAVDTTPRSNHHVLGHADVGSPRSRDRSSAVTLLNDMHKSALGGFAYGMDYRKS